jgi:leader peptidase (prepilin peptidase)/N-methyltransferase
VPIAPALAAAAGLLLGALLNLVIIRLPREEGFRGRPHCTRCGQPLAWWQLLPLIGWVAQAGRGRCCGRTIHWMFPFVELLTAIVLLALHQRYVPEGQVITFAYLAFVAAVLIVTGAIDWFHRVIYTLVILVAALLALATSFLVPGHSFLNALVGAVVAGFVFTIFYILARAMFPGHAAPFGLGDVYLGIFIGAALGLTNLLPALFYGMLLAGAYSALILVQRKTGRGGASPYISYGSFLCIGAILYLLIWGL